MDPSMVKNCDLSKMEVLARVGLDCVEEDRDIRPTMSQVVEMLQSVLSPLLFLSSGSFFFPQQPASLNISHKEWTLITVSASIFPAQWMPSFPLLEA
ncbi:hypothetical protein P8452_64598 [Trifolium repens]|nr:hypothetical protein P8452_64598 [Trifolium repens]